MEPAPSTHAWTVELLGTARLAAGRRSVSLDLDGAPTLSSVVRALAAACPTLVGSALDVDRLRPAEGHVFAVNGRDLTRDPATPLQPGDRLILLSSAAGG